MGCTGAARPNFMCGVVLFRKSDKKVTFELSNEMKRQKVGFQKLQHFILRNVTKIVQKSDKKITH